MQDSNLEPVSEADVGAPEPQHEIPTHYVRFQVGELLPWKGLWFEVTEITKDGLVIKSCQPIKKKHD